MVEQKRTEPNPPPSANGLPAEVHGSAGDGLDVDAGLPSSYAVDLDADFGAQEALDMLYSVMPTGWDVSFVQEMQVYRRDESSFAFEFELRNGSFWMLVDPRLLRQNAPEEPRSSEPGSRKETGLALLVHNDHLDYADHYEEFMPVRAVYRVEVNDHNFERSRVSVRFRADRAPAASQQEALEKLIERYLLTPPATLGSEPGMWSYLRQEIENDVRALVERLTGVTIPEGERVLIGELRRDEFDENTVTLETVVPGVDADQPDTEVRIAYQAAFDGPDFKLRRLWVVPTDSENAD